MEKIKLGIGSDHAALTLKNEIKDYLLSQGYEVVDYGTYSEERTDYPIYGYKVAKAIEKEEIDKGILICGTGIGISLAANKVKGIRAAVCSEPYSARMSVEHNNANIIAFGARVVGLDMAKMILDNFLEAEYEGDRHSKRVDMISDIERDKFSI